MIKLLTPLESYDKMIQLMDAGELHRVELMRHGVRVCTILKYYKSEKAKRLEQNENKTIKLLPFIVRDPTIELKEDERKIQIFGAFRALMNMELVLEPQKDRDVNKDSSERLSRDIEKRFAHI